MNSSLLDSSINATVFESQESALEKLCVSTRLKLEKHTFKPRLGYQIGHCALHDVALDNPDAVWCNQVLTVFAQEGVNVGRLIKAKVLDARAAVWGFEYEQIEPKHFISKCPNGALLAVLKEPKTTFPDVTGAMSKLNTCAKNTDWLKLWTEDPETAKQKFAKIAVPDNIAEALRRMLF